MINLQPCLCFTHITSTLIRKLRVSEGDAWIWCSAAAYLNEKWKKLRIFRNRWQGQHSITYRKVEEKALKWSWVFLNHKSFHSMSPSLVIKLRKLWHFTWNDVHMTLKAHSLSMIIIVIRADTLTLAGLWSLSLLPVGFSEDFTIFKNHRSQFVLQNKIHPHTAGPIINAVVKPVLSTVQQILR